MEIMIPSPLLRGWLLKVWWALIVVKLLWVGSYSEWYKAIECDIGLGSSDCWTVISTNKSSLLNIESHLM